MGAHLAFSVETYLVLRVQATRSFQHNTAQHHTSKDQHHTRKDALAARVRAARQPLLCHA